MKPHSILLLFGGILGILAIFLPWYSNTYFIITVNATLLSYARNSVFLWAEPLAAVTMILIASFANKASKPIHILSLVCALVGLGCVAVVYSAELGADTTYAGVGFWIAGAAFIL